MEANKTMLWIEDDYYAIKGLVRPLENAGFQVDRETSAYDGFCRLLDQHNYDLIVVDLILPLSNDTQSLSPEVAAWQVEEYVGIGLLKWIMQVLKPSCPVLVLSVVKDPISTYGLEDLGLAGSLHKSGLLPSEVKEEVFRVLGME